jgi:hypothetical protein
MREPLVVVLLCLLLCQACSSTSADLSKRAAKSVGARSLKQKLSSSANAEIAALAQSGRAASLGGESSDAAGDLNSESGESSEGSVALAPEQQHREDSGEEKETQLYTVGGGDSDDDDDASDSESSDREGVVSHTTALEQSSESFESDEQEVCAISILMRAYAVRGCILWIRLQLTQSCMKCTTFVLYRLASLMKQLS